MPKDPTPKAAPAATESAAEVVEEISLEEFCQRRSRSDRRVELIAAFHSEQSRTQQFKASESEYAARLDKFANQPV